MQTPIVSVATALLTGTTTVVVSPTVTVAAFVWDTVAVSVRNTVCVTAAAPPLRCSLLAAAGLHVTSVYGTTLVLVTVTGADTVTVAPPCCVTVLVSV